MLPGGLVRRPRPERDEDEDDLLAMQEEFLREKQVSSAAVVRVSTKTQEHGTKVSTNPQGHGSAVGEGSSVHGHSSSASCQHPSAYTQELFEEESQQEIADNHDVPKSVFDLEIIERDVTSWKDKEWTSGSGVSRSGFPKVTKYIPKDGEDGIPLPGSDPKSCSLFARQFGIKPKGEYFVISRLFLELIRVS